MVFVYTLISFRTRHTCNVGLADSGRPELGLLPCHVVAPRAVVGRDGHSVGGHGGVRNVVPQTNDPDRTSGQGGPQDFYENGINIAYLDLLEISKAPQCHNSPRTPCWLLNGFAFDSVAKYRKSIFIRVDRHTL